MSLEATRNELGYALKVMAEACGLLANAIVRFDDEAKEMEAAAGFALTAKPKPEPKPKRPAATMTPVGLTVGRSEPMPEPEAWHASVPPWETRVSN